MSVTIEYLRHLDQLRMTSKIRVVDFVDDVCSERQYRRYLSGSNIVPQDKFEQLCTKLGFTALEFYHSYHKQQQEEERELHRIYNLLRGRKFQEAKAKLDSFEEHTYATESLQTLDQYCRIMYLQDTKQITPKEAKERYLTLIDNEGIHTKAVYTFIDIIVLAQLAFLDAKSEDTSYLSILTTILQDPQQLYVSGPSRTIIVPIYYQTSRIYGMKNKLEQARDISKQGIEFALHSQMMNSLAQLYYTYALSLLKLGDKESAYKQAKCALSAAYAKQDDAMYKHLKTLLEEDFNQPFDQLED